MIAPFFSYYGSKWRDAKRYPAPLHDRIIEPFAGSAGYACRYADMDVILVEKDATIAELWRWLIAASADDVFTLPDLEEGQSVDELTHLDAGARYLIGFWLNRGASSPRQSPSRWMREGLAPSSFWGARVRERLARQIEQINHWRIIEGDYSLAPDIDATWFVDAPYQRAGIHYRHGSNLLDFNKLAQWCRNQKGQIIVCEQMGADWLPFTHLAYTKTARRQRPSNEMVWTR